MSISKNDSVHNFCGTVLRKARKELKLTQNDFAEPLSISGAYISKLEKNEKQPSEAVVRELVQHYGINRAALETGEGPVFATDTEPGYDDGRAKREVPDELLELVLDLDDSGELRLLLNDLKGKSPDEILEYVRGGRKALRGE